MPNNKPLSRRSLLALPGLLSPWPGFAAAEPGTARIPRHTSLPDAQLPYVRQLVALALARAGSSTTVELIDMQVSQGRSLLELARGRSQADLMWTMTDTQRESSGLIPIRIPIDRGLMGWRMLLVRRGELERWQRVDSLAELRQFTAGQGHDWPDTAIFRANNLPVVTSTGYEALFRMLVAGRFDYFPRSILEIDAELAGGKHADLAIVPGLMLYYPAAAYLFVSPTRPVLAADLLRGLEALAQDGGLRRLHMEHFGAVLRAHPVAPERFLRLSNPMLPPLTPLNRRELWLQPGE